MKREGRGCGDGRSGVSLAGTSDVAVTWVNQDDIDHTVTSGTPESPGGRFDATLAGKGSTAKRTTTR